MPKLSQAACRTSYQRNLPVDQFTCMMIPPPSTKSAWVNRRISVARDQ